MKRTLLIKHLKTKGCSLLREGKKHSIYINTATGKMAAIPRHTDINDYLATEICKELDIPRTSIN